MKRLVAIIVILCLIACAAYAYEVVRTRTCESCGITASGGVACKNDTVIRTLTKQHTAQNGSTCNYYYMKSNHAWDCPACNNFPYIGTHNCIEIHQCEFGARDVCIY